MTQRKEVTVRTTIVFITAIFTVIVVVTDVGAEDALPTATFKFLV